MTPQEAALKYPNLFKLSKDGVLEIYADNHILSSYRKCPGYFVEFILNNRHTKRRNWSLEFGQYFHKVMEYFYWAQKENWENQNLESYLNTCKFHWDFFKLNDFQDHPSFKKLGGYTGAFNLFLQYYNTHYKQERLRVIGTELSFGKAKEVPIVERNTIYQISPTVNCCFYYCGRIDLVVDDGNIIGPMDHKTTSYFDGSESSDFKPHDGMQGYVYSFQKMLPEELRAQGKTCNSIFINHISLQQKSEDKTGAQRFKHSIKSYTPAEMEEWRLRQVRTFTDIYRTVILEEPVDWNTEACNNWFYFQKCAYKELHELPPASREVYVQSNFVQLEPWSHENV